MSTARPSTGAPLPSDPAALEQLIKGQQAQLAESVDALVDKVSPKNVVARTKADLRQKSHDAVYTSSGELRVERVAAAGAGAVGLAVLALASAVRRHRRRGRRKVEKAAAKAQKRLG
jgi:ribosome-associated translation inhibitor RaiA